MKIGMDNISNDMAKKFCTDILHPWIFCIHKFFASINFLHQKSYVLKNKLNKTRTINTH